MRDLFDASEVRKALLRFIPAGSVFEVRAVNAQLRGNRRTGTVSGYFDNSAACLSELGKLVSAEGIYFTFNPVDPALLARRANRLDHARTDALTGNRHIVCRRSLVFDVDYKRPSGIGATDEQKEAAHKVALKIYDYLKKRGWPEPIVADSGNGYHLIYRIDLPSDDGGLIEKVLAALAACFDGDGVEIDRSVSNAARLIKLYGTRSCKGDDLKERPHRMSKLLRAPLLKKVTAEQLRALVDELLPKQPEKPKASVSSASRSPERDSKPSKEEIREMLAVIPKRPHYHDWIKVVAAVGDALSDADAIEVLNEWSEEEEGGEYAAKLQSGFSDIHVGTLIRLARQHGWTGQTKEQAVADDAEIARLAGLSTLDYEREREAAAEKLKCRVPILDSLIHAKQLLTRDGTGTQGSGVDFPDVIPWETPVNGAEVLSQVADRFSRYLALPPCAPDGLALWTAHTHAFEAFVHTPRLNLYSPEKQCGKTTGEDVLTTMVARPLRTENMTAAVLFRLVEMHKPTLLLDEVDSYLNNNEELRGLLNAGHRRGAKAYRCEGESNTVRGFAAFAPAALAGIGALPGTLHDRSVVIKLARAKPGEIEARFDSRRVRTETELCRKLARWTYDNFDALKDFDPKLPETAFNRLADNWRPLFAIAEVAGGDWPQRAHAAFVALTSSTDLDAQGIGTLLLSDCADIFAAAGVDRLPSNDLAGSLAAIEGRPWAEWGRHRKPISPNQLANQLRRFGISPHVIRVGEETVRGYLLDDFKEAFSRYLPEPGSPGCNNVTLLGKTAISGCNMDTPVLHPEKDLFHRECYTVTPWTEGYKGEDVTKGESDAPDVRETEAAPDPKVSQKPGDQPQPGGSTQPKKLRL